MPEVQDILEENYQEYKSKNNVVWYKEKTLKAIIACRTSKLGAHEDVCDECGYTKISYNSCRNRHCPKCQMSQKEKWINAREEDLIDVQYFHAVFTIPNELSLIVYQNQTKMYNVLFKAVSETLLELGWDKKYLGAEIGFMAILHTWGQNMYFHPHIHCIIPAGGIDKLGKWKNSKKKFFIPVKVLSRKFRGKFLDYMQEEKLEFYKSNEYLNEDTNYKNLISAMYEKEWVVYCKPPFKNARYVIEYLGRYTHRVAISNERILDISNGEVKFKWRDYKDNNKIKEMTISAEEFIRRFQMHILPPHFVKIRHFGILGNRNKSTKLKLCKKLTNTSIVFQKQSTLDLLKKKLGIDFNLCPSCKKGHLIRKSLLRE